MTHDEIRAHAAAVKELQIANDRLEKIYDRLGWATLWLFFIFIGVANL